MTSWSNVTALVADLSGGNARAADGLLPLVYDELHELANGYLRQERPGHTLQPTTLVHEAYLRLVDQDRVERDWKMGQAWLRRELSTGAREP